MRKPRSRVGVVNFSSIIIIATLRKHDTRPRHTLLRVARVLAVAAGGPACAPAATMASGNKRRMNMLLASFYGMQESPEQQKQDELDMDSAAFQVSSYVGKRLREDSLPELVSFTQSLGADTKGLDSGVQNLVYENYAKFIAATDTIRSMKTSVGEMEAETQRLVEGMAKVADTTRGVSTRLDANRIRVSKLVGVERLLSRLRFLFDLPSRLNRSIELDAHEQAVRYGARGVQ